MLAEFISVVCIVCKIFIIHAFNTPILLMIMLKETMGLPAFRMKVEVRERNILQKFKVYVSRTVLSPFFFFFR